MTQSSIDDKELNEVVACEHKTWDAWCSRDLSALEGLTATDYIAFDAEGVFEWEAVKRFLLSSSLASYKIDLQRAQRISDDVVGLSFTVCAVFEDRSRKRSVDMSVLSIWAKRNGRWLSVVRHEMMQTDDFRSLSQSIHGGST